MEEIIVRSQQELDNIADDYAGQIVIGFGTAEDPAVVNRRFGRPVKAVEKYCVEAYNNSSVEAYHNSSVEAYNNSLVMAYVNSSVEACGNSLVMAYVNSSVVAYNNSSVVAYNNSSVVAYNNSSVEAYHNSSVEACGNSSVVAYGNSSVEACGNSSVVAYGNSSVVARGNVQVLDAQRTSSIKTSGNARIVYLPYDTVSYLEYYGIEPVNGQVKLYKAVHKVGEDYASDYDQTFKYNIGETVKASVLDANTDEPCGAGINVATLHWCLKYGLTWNNLAILEVECDVNTLIVPINTDGKVRTDKVKVLREVPLDECGTYGKILAKKKSGRKE